MSLINTLFPNVVIATNIRQNTAIPKLWDQKSTLQIKVTTGKFLLIETVIPFSLARLERKHFSTDREKEGLPLLLEGCYAEQEASSIRKIS